MTTDLRLGGAEVLINCVKRLEFGSRDKAGIQDVSDSYVTFSDAS
jgi:hypothetical protein